MSGFQTTQTREAFATQIMRHIRRSQARTLIRVSGQMLRVRDLPEGTLRGMIDTGLAHAQEFGLTWEYSLASFVSLMFVIAPNFDSQPTIRALLMSESAQLDARADALWRTIPNDVWDEARRNYDDKAWLVTLPSGCAASDSSPPPNGTETSKPHCPECGASFSFGGEVYLLDVIPCPECDSELCIVKNNPIELAFHDGYITDP